MSEFCRVERDGRLLTVTIDRPEVMNALHPPANQELEKVFDAFADDPELFPPEREAHPAHGLDRPLGRVESDVQVLDLQERRFAQRHNHRPWGRGQRADRRPSG